MVGKLESDTDLPNVTTLSYLTAIMFTFRCFRNFQNQKFTNVLWVFIIACVFPCCNIGNSSTVLVPYIKLNVKDHLTF